MANRLRESDRRRHKLQFDVMDLSGGFVSQAVSRNIDERYLEDVQNMELIQGMWQKRKGYSKAGTYTAVDPVPGQVRGVHVYNKNGILYVLTAARNRIYVSRNVTSENSGRPLTTPLPYSKTISFADFRNQCYIAHGAGSLLRFDGDELEEIPAPRGDILAVYDNRLVLAGIKGDPLVFYYSERGDGEDWNALNYIALDGTTSEYITAFVPIFGKLYIFTNMNIYSLVGSMENFSVSMEVAGIGAASSQVVHVVGNLIYFISASGSEYKIFEYDGGNYPREISETISRYLGSAFTSAALEQAALTHYENSIWFTLNNSFDPEERITLVYYPAYQAWTKYKGIPAARYMYIDDAMYFVGAHDIGTFYQYGTQYNDGARAIDAYLKTTKWAFDRLENLKRFKVLYLRGAVQGGGGNGFDIEFKIDDSHVATVRATSDIASGTEVWGDNDWGDMYWGYADKTSGSTFGQFNWGNAEWSGSELVTSPKWGASVWDSFKWGGQVDSSIAEDAGIIYIKVFLSQYNVISGKTLQLVFRDRSPNHGFRFENLTLEYIQKGAR